VIDRLTAEWLVEDLTDDERARMELVEEVLPALRDQAAEVDLTGAFHLPHVKTLSEAGLLGLVIPTEHGGLGGGLRDLTAATFAMGTACPSTALAYFFDCSSASRGLLLLEALDAGLFAGEEAAQARAFAERVLRTMGEDGSWLANFASESVKSENAKITIATEAAPVDGGWVLNGVKAFGCATGVADRYLVTAKRAGTETADGICVFLVDRDAAGVSERTRWDAIGMRGTATHGIVLADVFVAEADALTIPGAFPKMLQMSRGSFVGNQLAATAVYVGAAKAVYDYTLQYLRERTFADTGQPIGSSPMHQGLIGEMTWHLESSALWLRRQLLLESSDPPVLPKPDVVAAWRLAKGGACEHAHAVALAALRACGTSNTGNSGLIARTIRDTVMGLVQAFPHDRGKLEAAQYAFDGAEETQFAAAAGPA
jgi:alkylation response protein AidB-like acyl-CoA dehydrogenase